MRKKIIVHPGERFGQWTVLKMLGNGCGLVRCDCGKEVQRYLNNLLNGASKSCGCSKNRAGAKPKKSKFEVQIGQRFTNWLVVGIPEVGQWVQVRCDCGKESRRRRIDLLQGNSKSCGCARSDNFVAAFKGKDSRVERAKRLLDEVLTEAEQAQVDRILESRRRFGLAGADIKLEAIEVVVSDRGLGWLLCHGGLEEIC
jgi:hypothetical protein